MIRARDIHDRVVEDPTPAELGEMVAGLGHPDNAFVLVERVDEGKGDWFAQALRYDNGTYLVEYRDGVAAEHYRAYVASREEVTAALNGWASGRPEWKDALTWENVGHEFTRKHWFSFLRRARKD